MIVRYTVECPSCGSYIILRIGVGLDLEQPFYFVCDTCNAPTKGKLVIWYEPEPGAELLLEEGEVIYEEVDISQCVTIHPDLPSFASTEEMTSLGWSPFLLQHALLGDRFVEFINRYRQFRTAISTDWLNYRRWFYHYLDRNWEEFDRAGKRILQELWAKPNTELQRHHCIHRALDLLTLPLWLEDIYP